MDIETVLVGWLEEEFPILAGSIPLSGEHADSTLPALEDAAMPFVRVADMEGGQYDQHTEFANVDIDVFDVERDQPGLPYLSARDQAYALSQAIHARLLEWPPPRYGTSRLDRVLVVEKPTDTDWENQAVRRFLGTYQFTYRL